MFSIVTRVRNRARLVARAIASTLGQSQPERELLVADDGLPDDIAAAVARFLTDTLTCVNDADY